MQYQQDLAKIVRRQHLTVCVKTAVGEYHGYLIVPNSVFTIIEGLSESCEG